MKFDEVADLQSSLGDLIEHFAGDVVIGPLHEERRRLVHGLLKQHADCNSFFILTLCIRFQKWVERVCLEFNFYEVVKFA